MIANLTQARDEILARLAASVTSITGLVTVFEDVRADTPDDDSSPAAVPAGVTWLDARIDFSSGQKVSVGGSDGSRRKNYTGVLFATLHTPAGDGFRESDTGVQAIMDGFDSGGPTPGGIQFMDSVPRYLGRKGAWQETAVVVDFSFEMIV